MPSIMAEQVESISQRLIQSKNIQQIDPRDLKLDFNCLYDIVQQILVKGNPDDAFITLVNDTLSICILRITQLLKLDLDSNFLGHSTINVLFEYILKYQNHSHHTVVTSINTLLSKLLNLVTTLHKDSELLKVWIAQQICTSISKNYFNILDQLIKSCRCSTQFVLDNYSSYMSDWIFLMDSESLANSTSKTVFAVLSRLGNSESKTSFNSWKGIILPAERLNNDHFRHNLFLHLLPKLFKMDSSLVKLTQEYMEEIRIDSTDAEDDINLSLLLITKDLGLPTNSKFQLDNAYLIHSNPKLRLKALSILFGGSSPKKLKSLPIEPATFKTIIDENLIEICMNDYDDIETRNSFISLFNQFMGSRFKDSRNSILKEVKKKKSDTFQKQLEDYSKFLNWLHDLLISYLVPSSTYSQLVTSLQLIDMLAEINPVEGLSIFNDERLYHFLIQCLFNNYDNIRDLSSKLLLNRSPATSLIKYLSEDRIEILLISSSKVLRKLTGRRSEGGCKFIEFLVLYYIRVLNKPDRAIDLLKRIVGGIEINVEIFSHGYFRAAGLIIENLDYTLAESHQVELQSMYDDIITKVFSIWTLMSSSLAKDAFDDSEEMDDSENVLSNYAWRVVKDSNQLLNTICTKSYVFELELVSSKKFLECCDLVIEQLSSVKHRGAFSSIYPSFIEMCKTCYSSSGMQQFPNDWLINNINLVENKTQYLSRRSGGIPFLISGVLIASLSKNNQRNKELASYTFERLLKIANLPYIHKADEKNDIPQVHAFNCIKQIFMESLLGSVSLSYVEVSLELSLQNFQSNNWSIRNCSVMLFNAIQLRVFGNQKKSNLYSFDLFFNKFPKIEGVLLESLSSLTDDSQRSENQNQILFPILIILLKLDTSSAQRLTTLSKFKSILLRFLSHKHWKIREMIARCIVSLYSSEELVTFASRFVNSQLGSINDLNKVHGSLLVISGSIDKVVDARSFLDVFQTLLKSFSKFSSIHLIKVYVKVMSKFALLLPDVSTDEFLTTVELYLIDGLSQKTHRTENQYMYSEIFKFVSSQFLLRSHAGLANLIGVALAASAYLEVQSASIDFIDANFNLVIQLVPNVKDILWQSICNEECFPSTRVKVLRLYSIGLQNYQFASEPSNEGEVLRELTLNSNADIRAFALNCFGAFVNVANDEEFYSQVENLLQEDRSFLHRSAGTEALILALSNPRLDKEEYELLMLSKVLYDDDKEIRSLGAEFMSKCYYQAPEMNSYSMINKIASSTTLLSRNYILKIFQGNLLEREELSDFVDQSDESTLFDVEPVNLYKNEVKYTQVVNQILLDVSENLSSEELNELRRAVHSDCEFLLHLLSRLSHDGQIEWSRDAILFNAFVKTILNCKTVYDDSRVESFKVELLKYDVDVSVIQYFSL